MACCLSPQLSASSEALLEDGDRRVPQDPADQYNKRLHVRPIFSENCDHSVPGSCSISRESSGRSSSSGPVSTVSTNSDIAPSSFRNVLTADNSFGDSE